MTAACLGAGQLGRMLALAGAPLGITTRFFDAPPRKGEPPHPAAQVAPCVLGDFADEGAVRAFARGADAVTYEFENVPAAAARAAALEAPARPAPKALEIAQDRAAEKALFASLGIPTPPHRAVATRAGFDAALAQIGAPAILKTRRLGYDGKGQAVIRAVNDADAAWGSVAHAAHAGLILEAFVPFTREVSMLAVRGVTGETRFYPLIENMHQGGVLRRSIAPAPDPAPGPAGAATRLAEAHTRAVLDALDYVGVLCVEFFEVRGAGGEPTLLANEMACRVHNSGHWTIDASATSQFENHLRAVLGMPLGATGMAHECAVAGMRNILGTLPTPEQIAAALRAEGARVHLYGKTPRPGRKLGHVTVVAPDERAMRERLGDVERALGLKAVSDVRE